MKREVLFDAAKKIVELDNGLVTLNTLLQMDDPEGAQWLEARHKATFEWNEATKRFDETQILVAITCGEDTDLALSSLSLFVRELAGKIVHKDAKIYERSSTELAKRLLAARRAIRKELGIDGTVPQAS